MNVDPTFSSRITRAYEEEKDSTIKSATPATTRELVATPSKKSATSDR